MPYEDAESAPEVSPEKRGSLWNACFAAAFYSLYRERKSAGVAAKFAAMEANLAVQALEQRDREEAERRYEIGEDL